MFLRPRTGLAMRFTSHHGWEVEARAKGCIEHPVHEADIRVAPHSRVSRRRSRLAAAW